MTTHRLTRRLTAACVVSAALLVATGCQKGSKAVSRLPAPLSPYQAPAPAAPRQSQSASPQPPKVLSSRLDGRTVVIDAGHGGKDPGAAARQRGHSPEKILVLDIARRLRHELQHRGARVIMTRDNDSFIELDRRAQIAERSKASLFVSVHADSARREAASGAGVHIYNKASRQSQAAALKIVGAFKKYGLKTRGVFRNNFHVLREHSRPAVLVECGFLTNPGDAALLNDAQYRAKFAAVLAEGIAESLQ